MQNISGDSLTSSVFNNKLQLSSISNNSAKNPDISLSASESRIINDDLVSEGGKSPTYQKLLKKLPIIKFSQLIDQNNKKCLVCQEEMCSSDSIRMLTCFHYYHVKCIDQWLKTKRECPLCKHS